MVKFKWWLKKHGFIQHLILEKNSRPVPIIKKRDQANMQQQKMTQEKTAIPSELECTTLQLSSPSFSFVSESGRLKSALGHERADSAISSSLLSSSNCSSTFLKTINSLSE